jgi:hypothetical protein
MRYMKMKRVIGLVVLLTVAAFALAAIPAAQASDDNQTPASLSTACGDIQVPLGNELFFHVYARGLQIYRWDGSTWVGTPSATLFADAGYHAQVGTHYGGPTWESNSGSYVKALARPERHPLVAAPGDLDQRPRPFQLGDLRPAGEHRRR